MTGDVLALIAAAASGPTTALVSGLTMAWPTRPKWVAFVAALLIGILVTTLVTAAWLPADAVLTRQIVAQVILTGIGSGLAAAGIGVSQASAQSKREEAQAAAGGPATSPDPVNPSPRVGGG